MFRLTRPSVFALVCSLLVVAAAPLAAAIVPDRSSPLADKEFRHPDLLIQNAYRAPGELAGSVAGEAAAELVLLGVAAENGLLDVRTGRWGTLLPAEPLVPGSGVGNELSWEALGLAAPAGDLAFGHAAAAAFRNYLEARAELLRLDVHEMATPRVRVDRGGRLVQIHAPRVFEGIPVRDSFVTAAINHGNLVLLGARNWGEIGVSPVPSITAADALAVTQKHLGDLFFFDTWGKNHLVIVPLSAGGLDRVALGGGLDHRLAWAIRPAFEGEAGRWEALVDAHGGELLAFEDTNQYATPREVKGGVYPVSNDGMVPDGVEQAGWPMPFADVATTTGTVTTDTGGNVTPVDGNITSDLSGPFVNIADQCGAISLTSGADIDFGTSTGDDCTTPGFGGAGNTHSARSGFYELNRIKEQAMAHLPANGWLTNQLTANMNINSSCNAFWNGSTVNFYRSGGGCANTGELAGVFDHEWGHGMDDNDLNPSISNPGEGIADIYAALRLDTSCIGRGFFDSGVCGGYGDPCISCDGIRDIDWAERVSGTPHDIDWINANCSGGPAPCGGIVHCEGAVYSEAVWDLFARDLPATYGFDSNASLEITTRLTYLGAGVVGNWYQCATPFGGCNADGGYLNYLAADDDNGNLADGTPHMSAIFDAFDRHQIACNSPAVVDSGCAGTPATAPVVTATPLDKSVSLSWGAVGGADSYQIFRAEGVFACDFGKVKAGETTLTTFTDSGLQNGRDYSYVVIPMGPGPSCFGPASACTTVSPASGPNLEVIADSAVLSISGGDGDEFLDNCEMGQMTFDVANTGLGTLTNVRITDVTPTSHPGIAITTAFPASVSPSTLPEGATGVGSFDFDAEGLAFDETVTFLVEATADELSPTVKSASLDVSSAESDLQNVPSQTYTFETDLEGWTVEEGTFTRTGTGGGNGTTWFVDSSDFQNDICDRIRSPQIMLNPTSTLSLWNNWEIEPMSSSTWYDRANVGVVDSQDQRTVVAPDGGRLYNADSSGPGTFTGCNDGEEGWADDSPIFGTWDTSSWSAGAFGGIAPTGELVQLEVIYSTDALLEGRGFWFDEVTVTDFDLLVADTQSDVCGGGGIPCGDIDRFQARCQNTPGGWRVQYRVIFTDASHDGETVTFGIDGSPDVRTINGTRALGVSAGVAGQSFTVSLDDPAGCESPIVVTCN